MSQALAAPAGPVTFRTSALDLGNTQNYWQHAETLPLEGNSTIQNGRMSIRAGDFGITSPSEDGITEMVTKGSTNRFDYNLTIKATSRAMLNAGAGFFLWGNGNTTQWSLPNCQTSGTIRINNADLEVDADNSMTWYDRQFGYGGVDSNSTWWGIQFPGSNIKAGIWLSNNNVPEQRLQFATVRTDSGLELVRFKVTTYPSHSWTSPFSNNTYSTKWFLDFDNGDFLEIESVRDDQEIQRADGSNAITAFANAKGKFFNQRYGFAILDIILV
ncbi:hypothetical protein N0V94_007282 [Neodidymelliopsis sp. IMI 364377]|nr:hypothetical protein N0V94_007282 [Neodidymelliopsis sp. IMI 364377]